MNKKVDYLKNEHKVALNNLLIYEISTPYLLL